MGRAKNAVLVLHGRQRNGTRNLGASALGCLDNLSRGGVEYPVVICLQPNSDSLSSHCFLFPASKNCWSSCRSFLSHFSMGRQPSFILNNQKLKLSCEAVSLLDDLG